MTTLTTEQAQQIEEALDFAASHSEYLADDLILYGEALATIRAARAQEQAEPVAWMDLHKELGKLRWMGGDEGWDNAINAVRDRLIELAIPQPVRTKDLTDDEIHKAFYSKNTGLINGIRAVIAADREKSK